MHLQSNKYILMVFEGQKSEPIIVNNLKQYFLNEQQNTIIYALYGNVIYDIYEKLNEDDFLDVVPNFDNISNYNKTIELDEISNTFLNNNNKYLAKMTVFTCLATSVRETQIVCNLMFSHGGYNSK